MHTETQALLFGVQTDIPGRTQQPNLFSLGFTQISLGAHSNPISFLWDSHRYPWAHTATRSLFFGIHTDIPGRTQQPNLSFFFFFFGIHTDIPGRTQQPDLFSLGFTQISLGAHSNPISLFFSFFSGFTQISLGAHSNPISLFFSYFFGIHTDIPGRTQQPDLFSLGFTQISLGAHSNPISFLWDSHRYPWAHTATRSLFFGIHTDIPRRTQQPDLFPLGFTQISLGAHSNPISFLWDSHRYPWAHTATQSLSLFFFLFFFFSFFWGFTQISLGAHSNPISFLWDSHRYPWAHTATQSLFFGIHTDIPGRTQQPNLFFFFSFFWDSHRYPWAHTATRSLFFGIHTDIPGRTQQPDLFSLGFTQISLGAHSNPISLFFSFFSGFTQISLGAHSNPISFLWDSHRYPWAHTATQSLFFFLFFGIHTDIPGRTQQPDLFSLGFTQISLGAHSNPISFLWDSHRYPWAHTATQSLFFFLFFRDSHRYPWAHTATQSLFFFFFFRDSHRYPWAHTASRSLFFWIHTDIPRRTQQPDLSLLFFSFFWDSHRYPWAHTASRSLFFGIHTDIPGRTQQPDLFSLGFTQISLGAHSNPISFLWDSDRYP